MIAKTKDIVRLLRIKHYIKNMLIFVPVFFAGQLFEARMWTGLLAGFIGFSLTTSVVYIVNDIVDADRDKEHEVKCKRPIASGRISKRQAAFSAALLTVISGLLIHASAQERLPQLYILTSLYLTMNILYSLWLKNIPILDVMTLASGFLIRILFGAAICGVVVSKWMYLTVMMMSLYMGLGKRKNEILRTREGVKTRKVLVYYTSRFLEKTMQMFLTLGMVFYALWSVNITGDGYQPESMIWTLPFVLTVIMRYEMLIDSQDSYGDPVEVLYSDKALVCVVIAYVLLTMALIYRPI